MTSSLATISTVGLTEVFSSADPQVDVVFVHGLNGNPYNTWTADNGVFWPRDLLPKHLGDVRCRILTYGYDARVSAFTDGVGKDHIHHHAENLTARLYSNRSVSKASVKQLDVQETNAYKDNAVKLKNAVERPIIFVVHSLGGLVTKQCLIYSRSIDHPNSEHLRSIFVSTYGILFMGTPHNGSDLAKWGTLLQSIASAALPKKFFDSSPHLVEALKTNNETLQNINRHFNEILPKLHIYFFYEARPMDLKGTRQFVVDEDSAAPNFPGVERMGIERDHSTMCKFEDESSTGFAVVAEAIRRYGSDAPAVMAVRWEGERQVREFEREMVRLEPQLGNRHGSSRGTSPDSRVPGVPTPVLPSNPRTPILLENGSPTVVPYEIEEQEHDTSRMASSVQLPSRPLLDSTNRSSPRSIHPLTMSTSISKQVHPMLVAPIGFRPNTHFIGFDIEIARLARKLADERKGKIGARSALLHGPPGCGKSHLAREYLWRHFEDYPNGIFWIDCKTPESLKKGFWNVAQSLGCYDESQSTIPDAFVDAVRLYLAHRDKWLLVFDGITFKDEEQLEVFKRFIPDGKGSSIIYTTIDRTLANRQRLLDPSGIKVWPLTTDQARSLLYESLRMNESKITAQQKRKATQLVKHYDCLPLGIHAAAHMLLARGRALEKYTPGPSDNRLASPFLSILDALDRAQQSEAVNLLMIMCFLNHEVPVAMFHLGHSALAESGVEVKSVDLNGGSGRRELDNSIAVLIRNGLIERRLQTHSSTSNGGRSSPEETRGSTIAERQNSEPLSDHHDEEETTGHEVESQNSLATFMGIDVIRVHTVVQQVYLDHLRGYTQTGFARWLTVAAKFVVAAWTVAHDKIRANAGQGSISDYREFESHAEKVWSHFPNRPEGVPHALRQARHDLHNIRRIIKREIDNQSPSQSSNMSNRPVFASIFERSGSSSDEGPATPTSGLTRISTWSGEPDIDSTESPVAYQDSAFMHLAPPLDGSWHEDDGYLSDTECRPTKERTTSTSTEKAPDERRNALRAIFGGRNSGEAWKPAPIVGSVSAAEVEPLHSRSNSTSSQTPVRPDSASSLAEAALSAVNKMSPPSTKAGSISSMQRTERRPLSELSSNSQIGSSFSDLRPAQHTSTSPHLRQALLANTRRSDQLPIEENISVTRRSQPMLIAGKVFVPSLPNLYSHSLPAERGATQMVRDLSHESTASVQTEPAESSNSVTDEFITPLMSPVEELAQPLNEQPSSIITRTMEQGSPYPTISTPSTEPLSTIPSMMTTRSGLGISSEHDPTQR